jgi:hypothetical protein
MHCEVFFNFTSLLLKQAVWRKFHSFIDKASIVFLKRNQAVQPNFTLLPRWGGGCVVAAGSIRKNWGYCLWGFEMQVLSTLTCFKCLLCPVRLKYLRGFAGRFFHPPPPHPHTQVPKQAAAILSNSCQES